MVNIQSLLQNRIPFLYKNRSIARRPRFTRIYRVGIVFSPSLQLFYRTKSSCFYCFLFSCFYFFVFFFSIFKSIFTSAVIWRPICVTQTGCVPVCKYRCFFRRPPITPRDAPAVAESETTAGCTDYYYNIRGSKPLVRISKPYNLGDLKNNIVNSARWRIRILPNV